MPDKHLCVCGINRPVRFLEGRLARSASLPIFGTIPLRRIPWITSALLVANSLVYLAIHDHAKTSALYWGLHSCQIINLCHPHSVPWLVGVFTALFIHVSILHLANNLLFLLVFGIYVEQRIGHWRYAALYFGIGMLAEIAEAFIDLDSPLTANTVSVGASTGAAALVGAYLCLYPKSKIYIWLFVLPLRIPAAIFIGYWISLQFLFTVIIYNTHRPMTNGWVGHFSAAILGVFVGLALRRKTTDPPADSPPSKPLLQASRPIANEPVSQTLG